MHRPGLTANGILKLARSVLGSIRRRSATRGAKALRMRTA